MVMWPDLVNGLFEFSAGMMIWLNVRALRRDKQIRGVSFLPVILFTTWGIWNLYFYAHLDQWCSWFGGISIVVANAVWLFHVWMYRDYK